MIICDFCGRSLEERNIYRVCINTDFVHPYRNADLCFDCQKEIEKRKDRAVAEFYKECKCKNEHRQVD